MAIFRDNIKTVMQIISVFSLIWNGGVYADDRLTNPSIRPQAQPKTIDIFADALYWYTGETVDWASTLTNSPNSEQFRLKTFTFDWAPGFRVGLGYNMHHDQWDTQLSYTWFRSKATDRAR